MEQQQILALSGGCERREFTEVCRFAEIIDDKLRSLFDR
jgi:hypothetical protein